VEKNHGLQAKFIDFTEFKIFLWEFIKAFQQAFSTEAREQECKIKLNFQRRRHETYLSCTPKKRARREPSSEKEEVIVGDSERANSEELPYGPDQPFNEHRLSQESVDDSPKGSFLILFLGWCKILNTFNYADEPAEDSHSSWDAHVGWIRRPPSSRLELILCVNSTYFCSVQLSALEHLQLWKTFVRV